MTIGTINYAQKSEPLKQRLEKMRAQMENERQSFESHWRDLADYILPRRIRLETTGVNRGDKRNTRIIDSTQTFSARTMRSGMMSGVTSPARPWFRLTTAEPSLAENAEVEEWLYTVSQRMRTAFTRSNLYNVFPIVYGDIGVFATGAMGVEEDFDNVARFYSFPIGSYSIANDEKMRVRTFARKFPLTVRQIIGKFKRGDDWSNISQSVKGLWERGETEKFVDVVHMVMKNEDYDPDFPVGSSARFISYYYEAASDLEIRSSVDNVMLSKKGWGFFPILCPRWEVAGSDVYGTDCPGMTALGDIKQLQKGEKRSLQAIDKLVNPPMVGPSQMRNSSPTILPGEINYVDVQSGAQSFRPVYEVQPRTAELEQKQESVRRRIQKAFFEDLFLMLATSDRREITAREIDERHEEKLLALGPVLEQINDDLLDPLIDIMFHIMQRQGLIPPAPDALSGQELKVEYISIMAQAQKLIGLGTIERFTGFAGSVAQFEETALDKLNVDEIIDVYAEMTGVPPGITRTDEEVAEMRAQRNQAAQQQQQMESLQSGAAAAKDLSGAEITENNVLGAMAGVTGGQ